MITINKSIEIPKDIQEKIKNTKIQRMIQFRDLNQYMGSDSTNSNITKNENGRPTLELKELEETAIHTPTQESYDTLMQIYECGDWKGIEGIILPTEFNAREYSRKITCVQAYNRFQYGKFESFKKYDYDIINLQKFYEIQKINQEMIQEISKWFEINKPNRKSKK